MVILSDKEASLSIAGLRLLQRFLDEPRTCIVTDQTGTPSMVGAEAIEELVDCSEVIAPESVIDDLCERMNFGDDQIVDVLTRLRAESHEAFYKGVLEDVRSLAINEATVRLWQLMPGLTSVTIEVDSELDGGRALSFVDGFGFNRATQEPLWLPPNIDHWGEEDNEFTLMELIGVIGPDEADSESVRVNDSHRETFGEIWKQLDRIVEIVQPRQEYEVFLDRSSTYVIAQEATSSDGEASYWSNVSGWGDLSEATPFARADQLTVNLPIGNNVKWVVLSDLD